MARYCLSLVVVAFLSYAIALAVPCSQDCATMKKFRIAPADSVYACYNSTLDFAFLGACCGKDSGATCQKKNSVLLIQKLKLVDLCEVCNPNCAKGASCEDDWSQPASVSMCDSTDLLDRYKCYNPS